MVRHLLGLKGQTRETLYRYLDSAASFIEISARDIKKVPALRGKTIINLFFEPSTRTLASFDIAGKRLSADTINISGASSSVKKGETLLDTVRTLEAMQPDILVMRHAESGAPHLISRYLKNTAVINAGDGSNEHPTQALLDLLTLSRHFSERKNGIEGLKIGFVGDVLHSRVARSNVWAHSILGNQVRLIGPSTLVPKLFSGKGGFGESVSVFHNLEEGLEGLDVIVGLRMQLERQHDKFVPSLDEYSKEYCISERLIAKHCPGAVILHPGPMNRGVEISTEVADGPRSLIRTQVEYGIAVRMAILYDLASSVGSKELENTEQ